MFTLILGLGGLSVYQLGVMNTASREIRDNWLPSVDALGELKTIVSRERIRAARVMATEDPAQRAAAVNDTMQAATGVQNALKAYEPLVSSREERELFEKIGVAYRTYADHFRPLLTRQNDPAAMTAFNGQSATLFRTALGLIEQASALNRTGAAKAGEQAEAAYQWALKASLGTLLVAAILSGACVIWLTRNVAGGIGNLSASMLRLSRRDYGFELAEATRADEIGEMARAVATCRDGLREADALAAAQAAEERAKAARVSQVDELLREFEADTTSVLRGVASAAVELDATAGELAGTARDGVERATSVAAASEQASANVQTVAASTEELAASIAEISRQVTGSAEVARRAAEDARATDSAVHGLSDAARGIGDVVRLINDIAGQTNLLALNATIEAARAGEAGRGFAVVASEVKTLAAQTAKATEQIGSQISAMQGETERAVAAIGGIVQTIEQINSITAQVAAAAEEQAAATREIGRAVAEAAAGTQEVSRHTGSVTAGAEQTGAASEQLRAASGELSRQAEQLRGRFDRFLGEIRAA